MNRENWTWLPHAAHFIASDKCQFHLATELGNGFIVSTIGEYWPERIAREIHASIYDPEWHELNNHLKGDTYDHAYKKRFGFEEIGYERKYETMVFKSRPARKRDCDACPYIIKSGENVDFDGYQDGESAYRGHMELCEKWSGVE